MTDRIRTWGTDNRDEIVKSILSSYRGKVNEYEACKEFFESIYPSAISQLREVNYFQEGVNHEEEAMATRLDHRELLLRDLRKKYLYLQKIIYAVNELEADEHAVIRRYYIMTPHRRIEDIAELLHMSESSCWRAHRRGIRKLIDKLTPPDSEKA